MIFAVPMMQKFQVIEVLKVLTPESKVFEYGIGGSTLFYPSYCKKWYSVEHNKVYYESFLKAAENITLPDNITTMLMEDTSRYIRSILNLISSTDIVLIDGICREECLCLVNKYANIGTVVILHDTDNPNCWSSRELMYKKLLEKSSVIVDVPGLSIWKTIK